MNERRRSITSRESDLAKEEKDINDKVVVSHLFLKQSSVKVQKSLAEKNVWDMYMANMITASQQQLESAQDAMKK